MKKLFLSIIALSAVTFINAQEEPKAKEPKHQKTTPKEKIAADGTIESKSTSTKEEKKTAETPKSGTRMAINEKGLPGTKSTKSAPKEEKK
jgi:hypothetical protein